MSSLWQRFCRWIRFEPKASHLIQGERGEEVARDYLQSRGMSFLAANFRSRRGEIDLIMRESNCLVFIEVKTRSSEDWGRPAAAVTSAKRRRISKTAMDYLRLLKNPEVQIRFDIVEVLMDGNGLKEIRHLPSAFPLSSPYRYG